MRTPPKNVVCKGASLTSNLPYSSQQRELYRNTEWKEVELNGELAEIPAQWTLQRIGRDISFSIGNTPKKEADNYKGTLPWLTIADINAKYISRSKGKITPQPNTKVLPIGTLLGSFKLSVGRFAFTTFESATNEAIIAIRPTDAPAHDLGYLYHALPDIFRKNATLNGQGSPLLNTQTIKSLSFIAPPMDEQSAIASVLSQQDQVVSDTKDLVAKLETRLRYFSRELLSGRLRVRETPTGESAPDGTAVVKRELYRNTEWKEVELNGELAEIPTQWTLQLIGRDISFSIGNTPKKEADNYKGTLPWLTIADINEKYISRSKGKITPQPNTKVLPIGTLLGSFKLSVGRFAFTTFESATNEAIIAIQPTDAPVHDLGYLYHALPDIFCKNATLNGQGSPLLNTQTIKSLSFVAPPKEEQSAIVSVLSCIEKDIANHRELLTNEQRRFQWLLNNLMSGKYRLKEVPPLTADLNGPGNPAPTNNHSELDGPR